MANVQSTPTLVSIVFDNGIFEPGTYRYLTTNGGLLNLGARIQQSFPDIQVSSSLDEQFYRYEMQDGLFVFWCVEAKGYLVTNMTNAAGFTTSQATQPLSYPYAFFGPPPTGKLDCIHVTEDVVFSLGSGTQQIICWDKTEGSSVQGFGIVVSK